MFFLKSWKEGHFKQIVTWQKYNIGYLSILPDGMGLKNNNEKNGGDRKNEILDIKRENSIC